MFAGLSPPATALRKLALTNVVTQLGTVDAVVMTVKLSGCRLHGN